MAFEQEFLEIALEVGAVKYRLVRVTSQQQQQNQQAQEQQRQQQHDQEQQKQEEELQAIYEEYVLDVSDATYQELARGLKKHRKFKHVVSIQRTLSVEGRMSFIAAFSSAFLKELRERICTKKSSKLGEAGALTSRGLATGLSAWLIDSFGLTNPMALGVAATILFVLIGATQGAFCDATDPKVRKALRAPKSLNDKLTKTTTTYARGRTQQQQQ